MLLLPVIIYYILVLHYGCGSSNILLAVYSDTNEEDSILIRIYGQNTERIIDRDAEIRNMKVFSSTGKGPALLATFANGIAYEFVPGSILHVDYVHDFHVTQLVVEAFADMHRMAIPVGSKACLWERMRKFLAATPNDGFATDHADAEKAARFRELKLMTKKQLEAEVNEMETKLKGTALAPIVYCHNDLLLGNIILNKYKTKVTLIDHEYGAPNYMTFDLGNHFADLAGVDEYKNCYKYYPKEDVQREWLQRYLKAYHKRDPTDKEVQQIYVETNKFCLCAHLKWGIWALAQAKLSTIDFDFLLYASQRLNEYLKRKDDFLALK